MRPYQVVFHFWIRPFQRGWGQLTPKSGILFKNFIVRIYMVECA